MADPMQIEKNKILSNYNEIVFIMRF